MCSRSKCKREYPFNKERCISIYTRKKLELYNKMSLIYCLMGLEGECKSIPNINIIRRPKKDANDALGHSFCSLEATFTFPAKCFSRLKYLILAYSFSILI